MSRRFCWNYLLVFKVKVVLDVICGEKILVELVKLYDVYLNQIMDWKGQLLECVVGVFGVEQVEEFKVDLKELYVKIGQQVLEIDFLFGVFGKVGLLSGKK